MPSNDRPAGQTVQTQNASPWGGAQPYLLDVMGEAQNQYRSQVPSFFPNSTVVPHSTATTNALGLQESRALAGSPLRDAAVSHGQATLAGDYLNAGNPHLQGLINRFNSTVGAGIDSQFMGAKGRFGSEGHIEAKTRGLGDALAPTLAGNYENERARQFAAMQGAPLLAASDYMDFDRLRGVGAEREALGRQQLDDQILRHEFNTNLPANKLSQYSSMVMGMPGSSQQSITPYFRNRAAGALGGGLAGGQVADMMGSQNAFWPLAGAALGYL